MQLVWIGLCVLLAFGCSPEESLDLDGAQGFESRCNRGDPNACTKLDEFNEWGRHAPKDGDRTTVDFAIACALDDPVGCAHWGRRTRAPLSIALFERACDAGGFEGCTILADRYRQGIGVTKDVETAHQLITKACEHGEPIACYELAKASLEGTGTLREDWEADVLLQNACKDWVGVACWELGQLTLRGDHVQQDIIAARWLFKRSCKLGGNCPSDLTYLSYVGKPFPLCGSGNCVEAAVVFLEGLDRLPAVAFRLLSETCGSGDPVSCSDAIEVAKNDPGLASSAQRMQIEFCTKHGEQCHALIERQQPLSDANTTDEWIKLGCKHFGSAELCWEAAQRTKDDEEIHHLLQMGCGGHHVQCCEELARREPGSVAAAPPAEVAAVPPPAPAERFHFTDLKLDPVKRVVTWQVSTEEPELAVELNLIVYTGDLQPVQITAVGARVRAGAPLFVSVPLEVAPPDQYDLQVVFLKPRPDLLFADDQEQAFVLRSLTFDPL